MSTIIEKTDEFFKTRVWDKEKDISSFFLCFLDFLYEREVEDSQTLFPWLSEVIKYFQRNNDIQIIESSGGDESEPICQRCIQVFLEETVGNADYTNNDVTYIFNKILRITAQHPYRNLIFNDHQTMLMNHH